jgi:hypothetical protein
MFKLSIHFMLPALLLVAGAAEAQTQDGVARDDPAQLYVKCSTVGSDEHDSRQCIAFRAAANREISACMSGGGANSHGYRALRLRCVEQQAVRLTDPVD